MAGMGEQENEEDDFASETEEAKKLLLRSLPFNSNWRATNDGCDGVSKEDASVSN